MSNYCTELINKTETSCIKENNEIFKKVISELMEIIPNEDIEFTSFTDSYTNKFLAMKQLYLYTSPYIKQTYEILEKYNYNKIHELQDAIFMLGHLIDKSKNKDTISKLLNSPYIDDITFDGFEEYTIFSEQLGKISFTLADEFFIDNFAIQKYMSEKQLPKQCHNHTYFLSKIFKDATSIISLVPSYFVGNHYHSYTYFEDSDMVIDLCSNAMMKKQTYDKIYEPKELAIIKNKDIDQVEKEVLQITDQPNDTATMLIIGSYNHYLIEQKEKTKVYIKP